MDRLQIWTEVGGNDTPDVGLITKHKSNFENSIIFKNDNIPSASYGTTDSFYNNAATGSFRKSVTNGKHFYRNSFVTPIISIYFLFPSLYIMATIETLNDICAKKKIYYLWPICFSYNISYTIRILWNNSAALPIASNFSEVGPNGPIWSDPNYTSVLGPKPE